MVFYAQLTGQYVDIRAMLCNEVIHTDDEKRTACFVMKSSTHTTKKGTDFFLLTKSFISTTKMTECFEVRKKGRGWEGRGWGLGGCKGFVLKFYNQATEK